MGKSLTGTQRRFEISAVEERWGTSPISKRGLAGVLTGVVPAVGGIYAYAQVRVQMGGSEQPTGTPRPCTVS